MTLNETEKRPPPLPRHIHLREVLQKAHGLVAEGVQETERTIINKIRNSDKGLDCGFFRSKGTASIFQQVVLLTSPSFPIFAWYEKIRSVSVEIQHPSDDTCFPRMGSLGSIQLVRSRISAKTHARNVCAADYP